MITVHNLNISFCRMIEIGSKSFPEIFHVEGMAKEACPLFIRFLLFSFVNFIAELRISKGHF